MVLISLLALLVLHRVNAVRKCCEQGESLNDDNMCVPSGHRWFYMNFTYGFPSCKLTESYAEEGASASCIEYYLKTGSYKTFECENGNSSKFQVPSINYVRKCCPLRRTYDTIQQSCYGDNGDIKWPSVFLNIVLGGFEGIVHVSEGAPVCEDRYVLVDYLLPINEVRREESESIVLTIPGSPEITFNPDDVCLDLTGRSEFLVVRACILAELTCHPNGPTPCVRKCCPDGQSKVGRFCGPSNLSVSPIEIFDQPDGSPVPTSPAFWYGLKTCENSDMFVFDELPDIYLDGLFFDNEISSWDDHCIEHVDNTSNYSNGIYIFGCFVDEEESYIVFFLNTFSMATSCIFLLLTLLVYSCLPMLRNLHGKTLMCHLSCLLVGFLSLSTIQQNIFDMNYISCKVVAHVNQFAFLAAFAWLNVISFDIWLTFGSMRSVTCRKERDRKRFIAYSIYAWSIATFFTLGAIVADHLEQTPEFLRPNMGEKYCFFEERSYAHVIFFLGPQILVVGSNIVFFILTAIHCSRVKNELHRMAHNALAERRFEADKQKLIMNAKLFIVMGISWALESISEEFEVHSHFWTVSDLANALQGVVIFLIFVMKKKVLRAFRRKVREVVCNVKPKQHRPSTSTLFTVLSNEVKLPHPLKKSTSDSRLSVGFPSPKRLHQRVSSSNQLTVSNHLTPTI